MAAVKAKRKISEGALAKRMARAVAKEIDRRINTLPVQDRYEAAVIPYQTRSWLYEGVQDWQYDMDPYTRTELLRVSRYFEKNSWVCKRLVSVLNQYTFGSHGLQMVAASQDEDYNEVAGPWWKTWTQFPDLTSMQPLSVLEHVCGRRWFFDGEIWIHKTKSLETGRPRVQLIEAHRVQNPGTNLAENGNQIIDGVEVDDSTGRPVAVHVAQRQAGSLLGGYYGSYQNSGLMGNGAWSPLVSQDISYSRLPIERVIHLFEPERAGQLRGIGSLYPVLRTIQDLHELTFLEKLRAKDAARTTAWITAATGSANSRGIRALAIQTGSTNQSGQTAIKPDPQYVETVQGGERQYLKIGENVTFQGNPNPSAAAQWFYDYLVRQICAGTGISALLVLPWSLQGTVTRADLDIMAGFFRSKSALAIAAFRELYVWVMGWAVRFDRSLDGYPADWFEVNITPPRSCNVDVGRNSQALIAEYQTGLRSLADICGELGHDWRRVIKQRAVEYKFAAALAEELGIEPEKLLAMSAAGMSRTAAEKPQKPEADGEPGDKTEAEKIEAAAAAFVL